jgi:serine phosphatase RsbU (regulator of sigma subunit)
LISPQQQKILITVNVDTLPNNSNVYVTGNTDELGNWNFMQSMEKKLENIWQKEVFAMVGDTLQFKFSRGDWSSEAVDSTGLEFANFVYVVKNDTDLVYEIPNWRDRVQQKIVITPQRLANKAGFLELFEGWKYQIGDDSSWAAPSFDDTDWKTINPFLRKEDFEKLKWTGNVWFRNHIYIDSSLLNRTFGLIFFNTGAAEIYLNGELLYRFGKVGTTREKEIILTNRTPKHIQFSGGEEQVIAVRYSNHRAKELIRYNIPVGFRAELGNLDVYVSDRMEVVRSLSIHQMAFSAFALAFAIVHFLLFLFYPKSKENLYYSICMFAFAMVIYTGTQNNFVDSLTTAIINSVINSLAVQLSILFGLLTVYKSSFEKIPKRYLFFLIVSGFFVINTIFFPSLESKYLDYTFYLYIILVAAEIVRVTSQSTRSKDKSGWGWSIGIGFLFAMIFIVYQILINSGAITQPLFGIRVVYIYGIIILELIVSLNLAKKFSDTTKDLAIKLKQVKELSQKTIEQERKAKEEELAKKLLEADNERKTKELEEARKLQLSMLPVKVPSLPNLDIAVYMKPAAEVGGDYYDFKYNNNGSLIIAIGDATGHGMKAGTMVAIIKGLFTAENADADIVSFLNRSNSVIRDMHMGNIFMAMLLVKINGNKAIISSAGMPPALIFRNETQSVEEIRLQALPLGGTSQFKYSKKETTFSPGDTLLLMSDGFPELFNKDKELLDYKKAKEIFCSVAQQGPGEVITHLCEEADNWRGNAKQEDDITFVVLKVK